MFLPRAIEGSEVGDCPPGHVCVPTMAIVGTDPLEKENNGQSKGPIDFEKPGPHRYIGVGMVAGMAFIVLVLWLTLGKWPRRMVNTHSCCPWSKTEPEDSETIEVGSKLDIPSQKAMRSKDMKIKREKRSSRRSEFLDVARSNVSDEQVGYTVDWECRHPQSVYHEPKVSQHRAGFPKTPPIN